MDTILVGELASTGHLNPGTALGMQPLRFLRALFCVDLALPPAAGAGRGRSGLSRPMPPAAGGFWLSIRALFRATGWSHHPYHLTMALGRSSPPPGQPDWVMFAELPKLEHALDTVQRTYWAMCKYAST